MPVFNVSLLVDFIMFREKLKEKLTTDFIIFLKQMIIILMYIM